jgi:hypothetical protein
VHGDARDPRMHENRRRVWSRSRRLHLPLHDAGRRVRAHHPGTAAEAVAVSADARSTGVKRPRLRVPRIVPRDPQQDANELKRSNAEALRLVAELGGDAKLLSLTVNASGYSGLAVTFGYGYSRARMWEQYAEIHKGVCLVFKRAELTELARAQIEHRAGRVVDGPVCYSATGLMGTSARSLTPMRGVVPEEFAAQHLAEHAGSFFLLKLVDWESEHGYRFVELTPGNACTYVNFGESLKAVILGAEFPVWQISSAKEMCRPLGAQVWQMGWHDNRPIPELVLPPDESPKAEGSR